MNPLALGLIAVGIVLLFFGLFSLMKNKKTTGLALSIMGLLTIAAPVLISYFIAR
jgi:membrane-bound ClpP family serine protease